MVSDKTIQRLGKTIGLLHAALRFARQGGMSNVAAKELNDLVARMFGDSLELDQLRQKPSGIKRIDPDRYLPIIECAIEFLGAGKKRRGMAGTIKRRLKIPLTERQINRILDEWMPKVLKELSQQK